MYRGRSVSLVLPSRDEREGLAVVLAEVPALVDQVVVVEASDCEAADAARTRGAFVVVETRPGYGRALKTGFAIATGDLVATMDADGTYPADAATLGTLLDPLASGRADFVSGSRFPRAFDSRTMPLDRHLGNLVVTGFASLLFGARLADVLSGAWAFRSEALSRLPPLADDWNLSAEIKLACLRAHGVRFEERPIAYRARAGNSTLASGPAGLLRVGLKNLAAIARMRLGR
jgi:glycosyltransferase involved in cell wall biosynthesis